jgi:hypothetical protein
MRQRRVTSAVFQELTKTKLRLQHDLVVSLYWIVFSVAHLHRASIDSILFALK